MVLPNRDIEQSAANVEQAKTQQSPVKGDCLVSWDESRISQHPHNWPSSRKWCNVALISAQGTLATTCSTVLAIGAVDVAEDFKLRSAYTPGLPVGLFVLGLGLGPLCLAPLSEVYGRRIVYLSCFTLFTVLNIGCALSPNIAALSILRLLAGMAASAGPTLGGSSISDMFTKSTRGRAQAVYNFGPTGGPALGGLIGGFITYGTGTWRWLMWIMAIGSGTLVLLSLLFLKETYAPRLLTLEAHRLRHEKTTVVQYYAEQDAIEIKQLFVLTITRPLRMLATAPTCTVMSIYVALVYGILFLHFTTIILLFGPTSRYGLKTYGWLHGAAGLANLGPGLGNVIGTLIAMRYMNGSYKTHATGQNDKKTRSAPPEARLHLLKIAMFLLPAGLIIFAWSAQYMVHWIVVLLGGTVFSTGSIMGFVCIQIYLVDIFGPFAASALATTVVCRSILGCIFSIVGFKLYESMGYGWGTTLLAFLCTIMIPVPFFLDTYGPKLRAKQFTL